MGLGEASLVDDTHTRHSLAGYIVLCHRKQSPEFGFLLFYLTAVNFHGDFLLVASRFLYEEIIFFLRSGAISLPCGAIHLCWAPYMHIYQLHCDSFRHVAHNTMCTHIALLLWMYSRVWMSVIIGHPECAYKVESTVQSLCPIVRRLFIHCCHSTEGIHRAECFHTILWRKKVISKIQIQNSPLSDLAFSPHLLITSGCVWYATLHRVVYSIIHRLW